MRGVTMIQLFRIHRRLLLVFAGGIVMFNFGCGAKTNFSPLAQTKYPDGSIPSQLSGIVNKYQLPAIQVAEMSTEVYTQAAGHENFQRKKEITPKHRMHVGSATKMFTAVSIMKLVEQGRLELASPLCNWFPNYPKADAITLEMLLNHSSGIENFFGKMGLLVRSSLSSSKIWDPVDIIQRMGKESLRFVPGSRFEYSNTNYVLLGQILVMETGWSLQEVFSKFIFAPLEMKSTSLTPYGKPDTEKAGGVDVDYLPFGKHYMTPENASWDSLTGASGGAVSTARDMSIFLNALFTGGLLTTDTVSKMMASKNELTDKPQAQMTGYGLGITAFTLDGETWYGHGGAIMGWESMSLFNPDSGRSVVVIINKTKMESDIFSIFQEVNTLLKGEVKP